MDRQREDRALELFRYVSSFDAVLLRARRQAIAMLVVAAAIVAWYGVNVVLGCTAVATTSGSLRERSLHASVTVRRDGRGVAHVTASSLHDLYFAQGFAEGSDRLFQMELTRRYALGTLAEIFGPRALPIDVQRRYDDIRDIAQERWNVLPARDRDALKAFSDGVNSAMHDQPLPIEFRLLLFHPQPWRPQDCIAVSLTVSLALSDSWQDVLTRDDVWRRFGAKGFAARFPLSDGRYDVSLNGTPLYSPDELLPNLAWRANAPTPPRMGSNAWAAGSERTIAGRALLANDPHLDLTIPGLWYLVDLRAPGMHVAGAAIPGTPGVLLGHNARVAWGATNGDGSNVSVFDAGSLDPKRWVRERFHVRFKSDSTHEYYRLPCAFGVPDPYRGVMRLVRRPPFACGTRSESPIETFFSLDRARDAREALSILSHYGGPAENFVVADIAGNVAYHYAGAVPDDPAWGRYVHGSPRFDRRYPLVPYDRLPALAPSTSAVLVTANNKMYGRRYPYRLTAYFDPPYRAYRIAELLAARRRYDAAYFERMQNDAVSPVDREFARYAAAYAVRTSDPPRREIARDLRDWNGAFVPGSKVATFEHDLRTRVEIDEPSLYAALVQLRDRQPSPTLEGDLLSIFYSAYYPSTAPWRTAGAVGIDHPLARLGFGFLNGRTLPGDGSEYTIRLQEPGFSQSLRAVWDVGDWDAGGIELPSGESGEPFSGHYTDMAQAWIDGRLQSLPFSESAVARATTATLVLQP